MARHLTTSPDPGLVWADANLEQPEAAAELKQHRADIAERRERRHTPEPVELDDYDDDLDIDEYDEAADYAPAPVGVASHLGMRPGPVMPALASGPTLPRPATHPSGLTPGGSCRG